MSYNTNPFKPFEPYKGQIRTELALANDNFSIIQKAFIQNDIENQPVKGGVYVGNNPPIDADIGTLWLNTSGSKPQLNLFDGDNWLCLGMICPDNTGGNSQNNHDNDSNVIYDCYYFLKVGTTAVYYNGKYSSLLSCRYAVTYDDYDPRGNNCGKITRVSADTVINLPDIASEFGGFNLNDDFVIEVKIFTIKGAQIKIELNNQIMAVSVNGALLIDNSSKSSGLYDINLKAGMNIIRAKVDPSFSYYIPLHFYGLNMSIAFVVNYCDENHFKIVARRKNDGGFDVIEFNHNIYDLLLYANNLQEFIRKYGRYV